MLTVDRSGVSGSIVYTSSTGTAGSIANQSIWCASARFSHNISTGDPNSTAMKAGRSAQTCYLVGLSEKIMYSTDGPDQWYHRRIVVSHKGLGFRTQNAITPPQVALFTTDGSPQRLVTPPVADQVLFLRNTLYEGADGGDWNNVLTAKLDRSRVTILSDTVTRIVSQNSSPVLMTKKFWTPIRKNIVYDDDYNGTSDQSSPWSTQAKPGCGDIYVIDQFFCAARATDRNLIVNYEPTLYWHEK